MGTELSSSNIDKECTKLDKYSSSLDSKPLVLKTTEAPMMKAPGKRLILPKIISPQTNSMSLKNVSNNEISKGHINSSKGKVISRIVYHDTNTGKKVLPTKPKFLSTIDTPQSQIILVEANKTSQSEALVADAELKNLIPARNLVESVSLLANDFTYITTEENYGTKESNNVKNPDTVDNQYCNEIDKDCHQGVSVLPGRQLLNIDPLLSDTNNAIELINDIDSLNKVSTQEDPEKDQVILEEYIPVSTNNTETTMTDSDIFCTWGADSLLNDNVPMPINSMMMVSPLTVEGKRFEAHDMESESTSSARNNQSLSTPQPNPDDMASETEMQEVLANLDEEYLTSLLDDIVMDPEESPTSKADVPEEKNDLLKMVMDDSIGEATVAQFCNVDQFLTLNPQDICNSNEYEVVNTAAAQSAAIVDTVEVDVAPVQPRRGPGRPRKPRTTEKVAKPRGRPARVHLNVENVMADHHNYSNGSSIAKMTTNERRYRRMRDLNNVASQRCRLKRKEKQQAAIDELTEEQEKNRELSMKVRLLEEQVAALKKHFIKKISNPRSVVTTSVGQSSQWDMMSLEKFVADAAEKHLGN